MILNPQSQNASKKASNRSEAFRIRLSKSEHQALEKWSKINGFERKKSSLIRAILRDVVSKKPSFYAEELALISASNRQLQALGRNLNQAVRQVHSGQANYANLIEIESLAKEVELLKTTIKTLLKKSKQRGKEFK